MIVLSVGWLLIYATRTVLSATLKDIKDFWGLSETYLGLLSSAFFMSYTVLQVPSGLLADKMGARKLLLVGFGLQAVGVFSGAFAPTKEMFLVTRVLAGAGQATYFACQHAIVSFTLPKERRAFGTAATVSGSALGTAIGLLIGKELARGPWGWRTPFLTLGALSIFFVWAIFAFVPEPGEDLKKSKAPGKLVKGPFLVAMCGAHFMSMYGFYLMLTWLPYYLETVRGYRGTLSAVIPIVMPLIMAPATIAGGLISDRLGSKKYVIKYALPVSAMATLAIPLTRSSTALVAALALYGATGKLVIDASLIAYVGDNAPPESRSTVLAVFNFAGALAMAVAPAVTGFLAETTGSFNSSFFIAGAFNLLALGAFELGLSYLGRQDMSQLA